MEAEYTLGRESTVLGVGGGGVRQNIDIVYCVGDINGNSRSNAALSVSGYLILQS